MLARRTAEAEDEDEDDDEDDDDGRACIPARGMRDAKPSLTQRRRGAEKAAEKTQPANHAKRRERGAAA